MNKILDLYNLYSKFAEKIKILEKLIIKRELIYIILTE